MTTPTKPSEAAMRAAQAVANAYHELWKIANEDEPLPCLRITNGVLADLIDAELKPQREAMEKVVIALKGISVLGGNLPDERLTTASGPNDALTRGLMYTTARQIAKDALAALSSLNL